MAEDRTTPYSAPVFRSLSQPVLLSGCDRELFLGLFIVCLFLGGPFGFFQFRWGLGIFAILLFLVGRQGLTIMAAHDPLARPVYLRSLHYGNVYPARAHLLSGDYGRYERW